MSSLHNGTHSSDSSVCTLHKAKKFITLVTTFTIIVVILSRLVLLIWLTDVISNTSTMKVHTPAVVITESTKLKATNLDWFPMA
jgi:hypothetical protein